MKKKNINNILKKLKEEIELAREDANKRGLSFVSPPEEQLVKKLKSVDTPFIAWLGITTYRPLTDLFRFEVGLFNPDPYLHGGMMAYIFFGPAHFFMPDIGTAVLSAYSDFPRLYANFPGIPSGSSAGVGVNYRFPRATESTLHIINVVVYQDLGWTLPYSVIDRAFAEITIV